MGARTNQSGTAGGSCSSVEDDRGGLDQEDLKPSSETRSALIGEVVQEEATTTPGKIPFGWARVKLEPDC
jgi:hypothetical protein